MVEWDKSISWIVFGICRKFTTIIYFFLYMIFLDWKWIEKNFSSTEEKDPPQRSPPPPQYSSSEEEQSLITSIYFFWKLQLCYFRYKMCRLCAIFLMCVSFSFSSKKTLNGWMVEAWGDSPTHITFQPIVKTHSNSQRLTQHQAKMKFFYFFSQFFSC